MAQFVLFSSAKRERFFLGIKKEVSLWKKFYPQYNISRSMFFNYLSGKYPIPLELFYVWKNVAKFEGEVKIVERNKYLPKKIGEITLDASLAEIIGVLNGDGHISKNQKEISIVGNKSEREYAEYLKKLFDQKLGVKFNLFIYPNCYRLKGYSVKLSNFFINNYSLPQGNKMGKLHIPLPILRKRDLLISYLRGLFDTDGTIYLRRDKDFVIEISSGDMVYLKEIKLALESLNFKSSLLKNHIAIYRKEEIDRFFELIKPANSKHLKKHLNSNFNKHW